MSASVTFRGAVAEGADGERINRIAALAGSRPPEGAVLLAELAGDPIAAVGIFDGHAVFSPGRSTLALRMRLYLIRLELRLVVTVVGV